jgi:RNA polymerase sigma-70 factor (ECF subfamily)
MFGPRQLPLLVTAGARLVPLPRWAEAGDLRESDLVGAPSEASNVDDATLAAAVATGDQAALETVFERYGGAVRSMALRVLRNDALADDTVQEVFVGFWNAPDRFDPGRGSLRTFLLTLAHRRAVDIVRSEQARLNREEKVPDDVSYSIDDEVWSRTVSEEVREAVAALDEGEREAISLAYFGGLTYIEVAERLGLPEGTVKSRIRSGMRRLGTMLAEVAS